MDIAALVVSALLALVIIRAIMTGSASVGGDGLRRDDQPQIYWTILVFAVAAEVFLIGRGLGFW